METPEPSESAPPPTQSQRLNRAFGPVVAGLIIDLVDLSTFGPIGLVLGLPVGAFAGFWMGKALGLETKPSLLCALAAGIYCTIPGTEMLPLATIVGAAARYFESDPNRGTPASGPGENADDGSREQGGEGAGDHGLQAQSGDHPLMLGAEGAQRPGQNADAAEIGEPAQRIDHDEPAVR